MSKTVGEFIEEFVAEEIQVDLGCHVDIPGFYCCLYKVGEFAQCPECEAYAPISWEEVGHGHTLLEAVINAKQLRNGEDVALKIEVFSV
jgi:hypothetical protein